MKCCRDNGIGPGPARFALPPAVGFNNHDITKNRLPAYSMAIRPCAIGCGVGPGPAKYTTEYQTHHGRKHVPAYMGRQLCQLTGCGVGPGPARYMLPTMIGAERTKVWNEKSPDFVFGRRLELKSGVCSPGPIGIPDTMGIAMKNIYPNKKPMYSMGKRLPQKDYNISPGPACCDPRHKDDHKILISMKGPYRSPCPDKSPGPASYNLAQHHPGTKQPCYSMGRVVCPHDPMIVPGDNC